MSNELVFLIVNKSGELKQSSAKNFDIDNLYKKCGFKKNDDFIEHHTWSIKFKHTEHDLNMSISVYGKIKGRANSENKYDFPPPIDNILFFGSCAIVASNINNGVKEFVSLNIELWDKIYEKLFGGFENLDATANEDETEIDELANIPAKMKTKDGYLKDGFVCDSDSSPPNNTDDTSCELSDTETDDLDIDNNELCEEDYE